MKALASTLLVCLISAATVITPAAATVVAELQCENLTDPAGIDVTHPRLSWVIESSERGVKQTACQILVASSAERLAGERGDLWDSGRLATTESIQFPYAGRALTTAADCFWKVRVWDNQGHASAWSKPAHWSMGLLTPEDWSAAKWIGLDGDAATSVSESRVQPARYLRKEFRADKRVLRAVVYLSGLGLSELYLNNAKVGDAVLSPAFAQYDRRVFYVTYDVTKDLLPGANTIGVILGNGRYYADRSKAHSGTMSFGWPKLLLQLRIEYTDGSVDKLVSDGSWKITTDGPIRANNDFDGEDYDARQELNGWAVSGFDDSRWPRAQIVSAPCERISAQMINPIRVTASLKPKSVREVSSGVYIYDLGQNIAGWCRLKVSGGLPGTRVSLRHAETLKPDGTLYVANLRSAKADDTYTLKGGGTEIWEPRFVTHGFRYVEVTGFPDRPDLDSIEGRVVNDDVPTAGYFQCSNDLINHIYSNVVWGVHGNYRSIPTDCPQRDERQGWLGDRSEESRGESFFFDTATLYAKWMQDIADSQHINGSVPDVAPSYWPIYSDDVSWPSTFVIVPEMLREQFGDTRTFARQYDQARLWMAHMSGFVSNGIVARDNYGDWCVPPEDPKLIHSRDTNRITDKTLIATAYFYHDCRVMAQYAALLGRNDDVREYNALGEQIKSAFNQRFLDREHGQYSNGTQTSCVLPLAFGLVPDDFRAPIFQHLVDKIENDTHGHIGTGLIGGQHLMRVLTENGRPDLAWQIATQKDYPSWGYMIEHSATTIWELWNGNTADPAMNSGNHVMLVGDLVVWFYENLAGIKTDRDLPAFRHLIMKPTIAGDLKFVKAAHRSPYGWVFSEWHRDGTAFDWQIEIPANSTATVYIPASGKDAVTESGHPLSAVSGVDSARFENGREVVELGSGKYHFSSR